MSKGERVATQIPNVEDVYIDYCEPFASFLDKQLRYRGAQRSTAD
jgi:hypothetical protein